MTESIASDDNARSARTGQTGHSVHTNRTARVAAGTRGAPLLVAAVMNFAAAVVRRDGIDPVTTELVRLRCATYHDCRT